MAGRLRLLHYAGDMDDPDHPGQWEGIQVLLQWQREDSTGLRLGRIPPLRSRHVRGARLHARRNHQPHSAGSHGVAINHRSALDLASRYGPEMADLHPLPHNLVTEKKPAFSSDLA